MISTDEALSLTKEKVRCQLQKGGSGFSDVFALLTKGEGKFLRTRLGLICSADRDGFVDEKITDRLSALELLHLATLIHDDVIDDADFRRGLPSVKAAFGKHGAVIAGDFLLTRCFAVLSTESQESLKMFAKVVSAVCKGEMLQERSLFDRTVTPLRYLKTVSGKTAALFSAAAAVSNEDFAYLSLGHKFGVIYQISDDIRDFTGKGDSFYGKPKLSDLKLGVMTLPTVFCLNKDPNLNEEEILAEIGYGILKSKEVAEKYRKKAESLVERAKLNQRTELNKMFNKIMQ